MSFGIRWRWRWPISHLLFVGAAINGTINRFQLNSNSNNQQATSDSDNNNEQQIIIIICTLNTLGLG